VYSSCRDPLRPSNFLFVSARGQKETNYTIQRLKATFLQKTTNWLEASDAYRALDA